MPPRARGLIAALAILWSTACRSSDPGPDLNTVPAANLAPRLLHEEEELQRYLAAFPLADYKVVDVPFQGKFYLDAVPDTIKDFLRQGIRWEAHIDSILKRHVKPGTTAIDVGAHIGTHTFSMAKFAGDRGRVYAFEPQRKIFRELVHNVELNAIKNTTPLRFAIGHTSAVIEMNSGDNRNEGGHGVGAGGDKAELRTLDSFGFTNVSVIKIDVEGFEDNVLDGARDTIARTRPVLIVEIMGGSDYEKSSPDVRAKIDASKRNIEDLGYEVTKVSSHDYLGLPTASR